MSTVQNHALPVDAESDVNSASTELNVTYVDRLLSLRASNQQKRTQSHIVRDNRTTIIGLIRDYQAKLEEIAEVLEADGEPVLRPGLFAEIRKQIGTVTQIRASDQAMGDNGDATPTPLLPDPSTPPVSDDDDDISQFSSRDPE